MKYDFKIIEQCNMCGSIIARHRILGKRINDLQCQIPDENDFTY